MTTANLVVNFTKTKTSEFYWTWHDGYQLEGLLEKAIKNAKNFKFTGLKIDAILTSNEVDYEDGNESDGRGDWSWTLTILDEKNAILTGAGCGEVKTKWINLENKDAK